jgi:hypothetical protein
MPISTEDIKRMSRRSTKDIDDDEEKPAFKQQTVSSSGGGSGNGQTEFNPDAGQYEEEIKKAQDELKKFDEVDLKRAKGEKVDEDEPVKRPEPGKEIGQFQGSANEEKSKWINKIAQLRSEASRRGLTLTV